MAVSRITDRTPAAFMNRALKFGLVFLAAWVCAIAYAVEVGGVKAVWPAGYTGPATIQVEILQTYRQARIDVDATEEPAPPTVDVTLSRWPDEQVEVFDAGWQPLAVEHTGIEWYDFSIVVLQSATSSYFLKATVPETPELPSEEERHISDEATGLSAMICQWYDGAATALSIRFDDSHPTHLSKAMPILHTYGFRGTFMINPGNQDYLEHQAEWEAAIESGEHEFANHTLHHSGATSHEQMEIELGDVCETIWGLSPAASPLLALNLGGGTKWTTHKALQYYLDKYHLFNCPSGSMGMDDVYGGRVQALADKLDLHIQTGLWAKIHYHYIGDGLSTSDANFLAEMEVIEEREAQVWIAGMADIYKHENERKGSKLEIVSSDPSCLTLSVSCLSDPALYDQPMTIELTLPESLPPQRVTVKNELQEIVPARVSHTPDHALLRFDVAPINSTCSIQIDISVLAIKNLAGDTVAKWDSNGNLALKGSLTQNSSPRHTSSAELVVKNEGGAVVAVVTSAGDMVLAGPAYQSQTSITPPSASFVIKNNMGEVVGCITSTGGMLLTGTVATGP